ncbi:MAG TPA: 4-(cytidine 5'-diphospho)-2-C-methyl-D-erythritol kinase [Rectinemataceae bacterium]|nr:4-(cytidine 5'-diphospho)-2-C-methyl-D-erythritol kinase [Rectinemataceae bacterium]
MKREIAIKASAKINIGLEVGEPRPDGYHPIVSIFHSVDIADRLVFSKDASAGIRVEGAFDCPQEATTVYKAASLFMKRFGIEGGFNAVVEKGIPVMAGLGGGSADAAAALMALNMLYDTKMDTAGLAALGAKIGADVPFFLSGGAAVVSGIGDVIEPIPPRGDFAILLVEPAFGVSTRWAFAELDSMRRAKRSPAPADAAPSEAEAVRKERLISVFQGSLEKWRFKNSFEEMLYSRFPVYGELERLIREAGAFHVSITGSGSCMYGVFASIDGARGAEAKMMASIGERNGAKTLCGMALHAIKPLETSLLLG